MARGKASRGSGKMRRGNRADDLNTLQMALVGYQIEKEKIEDQIRVITSLLKGKRVPLSGPPIGKKAPAVKRVLSAAARKRISAAQTKRWAEHHKRMAQTAV